MAMKLLMLVIFFAIMVSVGIYARKHATRCRWLCVGRTIGWSVADGICIWNVIFFSGCICRICRTVRMEIWSCRTWIGIGNAIIGSLACMGCTWKTYQDYDTAFESMTMPDFFGERYGSKALKITASVDCIHFPDSVYSFCI